MRNRVIKYLVLVPLALSLCLADGICPAATFLFPADNPAVESAAGDQNLRSVAKSTTDPDVWLGLSLFPQPGNPLRNELSALAVKAKPQLAPMAIVFANAMNGPDDQSIADLIKADPDNALGYYIRAVQLNKPGTEKDSLDAFRKGATCHELRLYGETVSNAVFKALDALNLKGRDRLSASSWLATRWMNFEILNLQPPANILKKLASTNADVATKKEISDLILTLGGQFADGDLLERQFSQRALIAAFHMKADIAATENSPAMDGYAAVVQSLVSTATADSHQDAMRFPDRFFMAATIHNSNATRPPSKDRLSAADKLVEAALPDLDEIVGAYFCGRMPSRTNLPAPWSMAPTYTEKLMAAKPELRKALEAYEAASRADFTSTAAAPARASSPQEACINNLRQIDGAKQTWALEMGKKASDVPTWKDIEPYLRKKPTCPTSGTYTVGAINEKPTCSISGHALP